MRLSALPAVLACEIAEYLDPASLASLAVASSQFSAPQHDLAGRSAVAAAAWLYCRNSVDESQQQPGPPSPRQPPKKRRIVRPVVNPAETLAREITRRGFRKRWETLIATPTGWCEIETAHELSFVEIAPSSWFPQTAHGTDSPAWDLDEHNCVLKVTNFRGVDAVHVAYADNTSAAGGAGGQPPSPIGRWLVVTRGGIVFSRGDNSCGALARGRRGRCSWGRVSFAGFPRIATVAAAENATVFLDWRGRVWVCGARSSMCVDAPPRAFGRTECLWQPRAVPSSRFGQSDNVISAVSSGSSHVAVITKSGRLFTWGWGWRGRLGHGDTTSKRKPCRVNKLPSSPVSSVSCGPDSTGVVLEDGEVFTWGSNACCALGYSSGDDPSGVEMLLSCQFSPARVTFPVDVESSSGARVGTRGGLLKLADFRGFMLLRNGDLYAWGALRAPEAWASPAIVPAGIGFPNSQELVIPAPRRTLQKVTSVAPASSRPVTFVRTHAGEIMVSGAGYLPSRALSGVAWEWKTLSLG